MATHEQVAAIPDMMYFVLQCFSHLKVELGCFVATFTHTFTHILAKPQADVLFIIHVGDSAFTTAKIGSYMLFLLILK